MTWHFTGATTLLAYFHYCNKGVYPFSEECRDNDLATLAGMNETMIQYVRDSRIYVTEHSKPNLPRRSHFHVETQNELPELR